MTQRGLTNSRGSNGHCLGNVEGDSGIVLDGLLVQNVALTLIETYRRANIALLDVAATGNVQCSLKIVT